MDYNSARITSEYSADSKIRTLTSLSQVADSANRNLTSDKKESRDNAYSVKLSEEARKMAAERFERSQQADEVQFAQEQDRAEEAFRLEQIRDEAAFERDQQQKRAEFERRQSYTPINEVA